MSERIKKLLGDWDVKDVRNVIITALSIIIPIYFHSIISFFGNFFNEYSNFLSTKFVNTIYKDAAANPTIQLNVLIFLGVFFLPLAVVATNVSVRRSTRKQAELSLFPRSWLSGFLKYLSLIVFSVSMFTALMANIVGPVIIYSKFQQRLSALSPMIAEQDYKVILSKWSLMTSKEDFNVINDSLKQLAKLHNIVLP